MTARAGAARINVSGTVNSQSAVCKSRPVRTPRAEPRSRRREEADVLAAPVSASSRRQPRFLDPPGEDEGLNSLTLVLTLLPATRFAAGGNNNINFMNRREDDAEALRLQILVNHRGTSRARTGLLRPTPSSALDAVILILPGSRRLVSTL